MAKKAARKKAPQDLTLRNLRAVKKRLAVAEHRILELERDVRILFMLPTIVDEIADMPADDWRLKRSVKR